ncbi:DUF2523 domain-containing protein [Vibrio cholerae]|uniref:DUF2523 domain-containing protein n=1 Tax=Vibrio cholerae TaxID=666 RepID=UPI00115AF2BC|nr:DUF2523 domain-containing protein [Vibrio cholerae]TQP79886.1 DUF2523 domain-containing protein [Vibrio cholerae]
MPHFIAFLFMTILPLAPALLAALATRVAVSIGFGTATYVGVNLIFDRIFDKIQNEVGGLPANVIQMIGLIGITDAINIVMSAAFALLTFKGMNKLGQARTVVWRKPGDKSPIDWSA